MKIVPIIPNEDANKNIYSSANCQQCIELYREFYPKIGFNPPWIGYFIIKDKTAVGSCGFIGAPKNKTVEIAYWTFEEFEGQGIATFACQELISIARNTASSILITAKTAPEENASTQILKKNNFKFSEIVQDEEIGDAWLWRYSK